MSLFDATISQTRSVVPGSGCGRRRCPARLQQNAIPISVCHRPGQKGLLMACRTNWACILLSRLWFTRVFTKILHRCYIAVTSEDWHRVTEWLAPKPGAGFRHQAPEKIYRKTP